MQSSIIFYIKLIVSFCLFFYSHMLLGVARVFSSSTHIVGFARRCKSQVAFQVHDVVQRAGDVDALKDLVGNLVLRFEPGVVRLQARAILDAVQGRGAVEKPALLSTRVFQRPIPNLPLLQDLNVLLNVVLVNVNICNKVKELTRAHHLEMGIV